jgi:hypothetical protein
VQVLFLIISLGRFAFVAAFSVSNTIKSKCMTLPTYICIYGSSPNPSSVPVTIDFKVVAGGKGAEWGEISETFAQSPGTVLYTTVTTYPLGCVIEEVEGGSALEFTEVNEGLGGALAGIQKGDRLRAVTALTLPRLANLSGCALYRRSQE